MRRQLGRISRTLALVGLLALGANSARAAFLTGAAVYSTDAAGAPSSGEYWNTLGGDNRYNLYVAIGDNDPILNPGNSSTSGLILPLPVGTYTYNVYGEAGGSQVIDHYGLALYFNGNNSAPGIVAFTATGASSGAQVVPTSDGSIGLDTAAAASPGTLSFSGGTTTVTLDGFTWAAPKAGGLDRVSGYDSTANGQPDFLGSFTLSVSPLAAPPTAVPEPASMALLGLGTAGLGLMARRRMARASA